MGRRKRQKTQRLGPQMLSVSLTTKLHAWLAQMAAEDERTIADFVRRLLKQEWMRREEAVREKERTHETNPLVSSEIHP